MALTRMSDLFVRTLREDPSDAEGRSHVLLTRAGYVRRVAAGVYTWLPLGVRVLRRVERIIRQEMEAIGAQEVRLPAMVPAGFYEISGRLAEYGDLLLRVEDRRGSEFVMGPTHEELFTELARSQCDSYRDLPVTLFQIQTKFRDEARPRSGVLRGREFVMKDSYSFDLDEAGLRSSYQRHRDAYGRVFARMGLRVVTVSAISGAMGGSHSEEFLAPAEAGEDLFVTCAACGYAANVEASEVGEGVGTAPDDRPPMTEVDTPGTPTIESLVAYLGGEVIAASTLKNLLVKVGGRVVAVGVPGDRDVDVARLETLMEPEPVEPFTAEDFALHPGLVRGYVGPQGLRALGVPYFADPRVAPGTAWVTGSNREGRHVINAVAGRDFEVDRYLPVAIVLAGDPCPRCGGPISVDRGIEVGHIFQLGTKYTEAFDFAVTGPDGAAVRVVMGSYGLGVSRVVGAVAEQTADEAGLCWPSELAPFDVHVVVVARAEDQRDAAFRMADDLAGRFDVLLDDRGVAPGVAFADADLIGVPTIVIAGRGLSQGVVEVKDRATGTRHDVPLSELTAFLEGAQGAGWRTQDPSGSGTSAQVP